MENAELAFQARTVLMDKVLPRLKFMANLCDIHTMDADEVKIIVDLLLAESAKVIQSLKEIPL